MMLAAAISPAWSEEGHYRMSFTVQPIGFVRSTRTEVADDDWDEEQSSVVLVDEFGEDALLGLADFSHAEIVYYLDRVEPGRIERGARRPRNNPDWPIVGIFAQRGKNRPNRIGTTTCQIGRVEGRTLVVHGLDAVDGTPVLDIKPYMAEFGPRGAVVQPAWSTELMSGYWHS